ncbi:FtsL-like putative cell division protein [Roseivirga sp. E12]|uniref:FtsL-like putative cell division protein n=1 Tax=Roseivirga sp. E12 TaxID=2819237 RepID=UPI001ABC0997|nr:FtsL-like putative cell division protein [Roseivirga sp. E12]MBO3700172.1 hypothetical protein [Roseivirga sp. E12]
MAENRFRVRENDKPKGRGFFGFLSAKLGQSLNSGLPVKHLPKVAFTVLLGVFYVWNNHYAERTVRHIDKLEDEVEDLRADVTTLEANYMYSSKQSEVAKKVKALGLEESMEPPAKIIVEDNEY